ncbi:MAG: ATP-binding cassette domain-containing protein [Bacilli bacterium]|nr:ATP-binding cassette domain-containing protein [Bacilli bacterium]
MANEKPILIVNNLRISFKTNTGTVKAVRGIDFSLYKGRTLAIVGESGSGKSVTSKAVLGILANNKIIEDGRIIYDGKDLLTLPEAKFTKVRGVKISMIFQDPLSALNPIKKVGKQLTEAMILENKAVRKSSRKFVSRINSSIRRNALTEQKELLTNLRLACKSIKDAEELNNEIKNNYLVLFKNAAEIETEKFVSCLNIALEEAKFYKDNFLPEERIDFSVPVAKTNSVKLIKALKKCKNFFSNEADDVIDVHGILLDKYLRAMISSDKEKAALDKLLAENGVESVFDLPAKLRTKEKEVITPSTTYYQSIKDLTDRLIAHLEELVENYKNVGESRVLELIDLYAKMTIQKSTKLTAAASKARAVELMREVGIPEPEKRFYQYPFEFSGGMRQRIVIAIALSGNPEILICDEPTTALDVTIQAQILELIQRLKVEKNLSIIFITHDLGVVANMADDIAVMYAGKIVEYGSVYDIFYDPRHPYTWALLSSMPDLETKGKLDAIPGTPPNMLLPPRGDAFAARNSYAVALDYKQEPPFFRVSDTHSVKTWLAHQDAIDVVPPKSVINRIKNSLKKNPENFPQYELKKNSILEIVKGGK